MINLEAYSGSHLQHIHGVTVQAIHLDLSLPQLEKLLAVEIARRLGNQGPESNKKKLNVCTSCGKGVFVRTETDEGVVRTCRVCRFSQFEAKK
jgi:hypothetical protein